MTILRSFCYRFEQVSIDEAFLDLSPVGSFSAAELLAGQIKTMIRTTLGLSCSVGVAPSKLVAKIASDFKKPDGLTIVKPEKVAAFLSQIPVKRSPVSEKSPSWNCTNLGSEILGTLLNTTSSG